MRIKVTVYLRPKTVAILLDKKGISYGGQKWLAQQIGVSEGYVSMMMKGVSGFPVPARARVVLWDLFRGMSHKPGGRLTDDDLFQRVVREDGSLSSI